MFKKKIWTLWQIIKEVFCILLYALSILIIIANFITYCGSGFTDAHALAMMVFAGLVTHELDHRYEIFNKKP